MTITQKKRCSKIFLVTPKRRTYGKSRNTFLRPHPVTGTVWIYIYGIKLPYPAFLCKFLQQNHKTGYRMKWSEWLSKREAKTGPQRLK